MKGKFDDEDKIVEYYNRLPFYRSSFIVYCFGIKVMDGKSNKGGRRPGAGRPKSDKPRQDFPGRG